MFRSLVLSMLFSLATNVYGAEVALTFDDSPMRSMSIFSGTERTQKLIELLNKYKIQTVFFTNTSKFSNSNGLERMKSYDLAGHFIANHTHTHPNFNDTSLKNYIEDFELADEYEKGNFSIERNIYVSLHSGLGIDTYPIGVNESPDRVIEILKLLQALSNKYKKPLSCRFVSDGVAEIGEMTNFKNEYLKDVTVRQL